MDRSEAGKLGFMASCKTNEQKLKERVNAYVANPTHCNFCDSVLEYKKRNDKYCSRSCAAKFNNTVRERQRWAKPKATKEKHRPYSDRRSNKYPCSVCGNLGKSATFCSNKCSLVFKEQARFAQFQTGSVSATVAKKILIKLHGFKCMECGWDKINPVSKKCPVELEHMDGNSQNNLPENLKLLCPNCHSLTPTYKALNVGKGRFSRMQRYNEGKSS